MPQLIADTLLWVTGSCQRLNRVDLISRDHYLLDQSYSHVCRFTLSTSDWHESSVPLHSTTNGPYLQGVLLTSPANHSTDQALLRDSCSIYTVGCHVNARRRNYLLAEESEATMGYCRNRWSGIQCSDQARSDHDGFESHSGFLRVWVVSTLPG